MPNENAIELAKKVKKFLYYKHNPIAFIEENIKIPTPGGSELLKLYEPQKRIIREFFDNNYLLLLKSRQIGMSTLTMAIIVYICCFYKNCIMGVVSRKGDEASDYCRKVEVMLEELPSWICPKFKNKATQYFTLENGCALFTETVSPSNPGSIFRGKSVVLLVLDEAAFIRNIDAAWTAVAPSLSKAQQTAKIKEIPFGTIIMSTPNKAQGIGFWYFDMFKKAKRDENGFKPCKIHWKEIDAFRDDPNWYIQQCRLLGNDPKKIAQELELKFVGSDSSLFDDVTQERLQDIKTAAIEERRTKYGGKLKILSEIKKNELHLISADTASAAGGDFSTIEVMNYKTCEQVLEFRGKMEPKLFAEELKMISLKFPNHYIIVENTGGYGLTVLNELSFDENVAFNIYGEYIGPERKKRWKLGLSTNSRTRPLIMDALYTNVTENIDCLKSEDLALELLSLTNKTEKIEADTGFNDDLAMSWGFCCYIRKYALDNIPSKVELAEEDSEEDMLLLDETLGLINELNTSSPFLFDYLEVSEEEDPELKDKKFLTLNKKMDKYIKDKISKGEISGNFDTTPLLFGDNLNMGNNNGR